MVASSVQLRGMLGEAVVALGVMLWARTNLTHPQLSGAFTNKMAMPPLLALFVAIAQKRMRHGPRSQPISLSISADLPIYLSRSPYRTLSTSLALDLHRSPPISTDLP